MDGISRYSLNITNDKSSSELTDAAKLVALKEDAQIIKNIDQSQKKNTLNEKHLKKMKMKKNLLFRMNMLTKMIKIMILMVKIVSFITPKLKKYTANMIKMI